jgi:hypothetical protein
MKSRSNPHTSFQRRKHRPTPVEIVNAPDSWRAPPRHEPKHPLDIATVSAVIAAGAAVLAAIYTRSQVSTAQDTEKRQLRAYVSIERLGIDVSKWKESPIVKGGVVFKNSGLTPAYKVSGVISMAFSDFPLRAPIKPSDLVRSMAMVGAGNEMNASTGLEVTLTGEQQFRVENGSGAIYIFGQVGYTDAFEDHYCTRFSYFYRGNPVANPDGEMMALEEGNEELRSSCELKK